MPLRAGLAWTRTSRSFGMQSFSIDETSANNAPIDSQILANEHLTSMHRISNEVCFWELRVISRRLERALKRTAQAMGCL